MWRHRRPSCATIRTCRAERQASGPLAQRLEQGTHNPLVAGSNPAGPTSSKRAGQALRMPDLLGIVGVFPAGLGVHGERMGTVWEEIPTIPDDSARGPTSHDALLVSPLLQLLAFLTGEQRYV